MRYTPESITELKLNEVFVFGSNEAGVHGAGAALYAMKRFAAVYGCGFGKVGQTFAIPTKDWKIQTLDIGSIQFYVDRFIAYAELHPQYIFLVTPIGCGLAGYTVEEIAPLFERVWRYCALYENIILPKSFHDYFENEFQNFNSIFNKTTSKA